VLFVIYGMLALVFKSYLQPLIVLSVVPFGIIGAVLGHVMIGIDVSIMSMFGLIALVGVVVNDSIVMVDYINRHRDDGLPFEEAIPMAGVMRFRAVLLTSLTTFFGLIPLILEKSTQAQFLIPMAVSLAFGILFSTIVTLGLVPVCYLIGADFRKMGARVKAWLT